MDPHLKTEGNAPKPAPATVEKVREAVKNLAEEIFDRRAQARGGYPDYDETDCVEHIMSALLPLLNREGEDAHADKLSHALAWVRTAHKRHATAQCLWENAQEDSSAECQEYKDAQHEADDARHDLNNANVFAEKVWKDWNDARLRAARTPEHP